MLLSFKLAVFLYSCLRKLGEFQPEILIFFVNHCHAIKLLKGEMITMRNFWDQHVIVQSQCLLDYVR